jgi:hypothetical protein
MRKPAEHGLGMGMGMGMGTSSTPSPSRLCIGRFGYCYDITYRAV